MNPMNSSNGLHKLARPTWNRSARTTRRGGRTVREALPIHLVIVGQWAIAPHCNGFPGRRRSEPASGGHAAVVIIASAGVGSDGVWTPSDIAWVPSLQNADPPHRWCSLTAGATCHSPEVDAAALAASTEAVDLYGADNDGAHPLERP
jgi:hypothetical protein